MVRVSLTNSRTGLTVSGWLSEDRPGLEAALLGDYQPAMRLITKDDVTQGDTLSLPAGDRYVVRRVYQQGGRSVAELAKVT